MKLKLSPDEEQREAKLLETCERWQRGGHLLDRSGFKAAAELYLLYAANGGFVSHNSIIRHMADRFQKLDISSCRGATMTRERVDWLYENKLQRLAPMKV